ncbi:MAG: efflux RND transporter periplasmic adaptor subunit [Nitrospiraceae bacterium]|nr:efflux RND transporter periplasmic adaptor subunit [Nitrospiraceae bacterium]
MSHRWYFVIAAATATVILALLAVYLLKGETPEGVLEGSGQVRGTEVTVAFKLAGKVEKLLIQEGQAVSKGDLIATISSKEIEARVEQATAEAEAARSRLKEIQATIAETDTSLGLAEVSIKLAKEDSFHRIHQARAAFERSEAEVRDAQSLLEQAKNDYERYRQLMVKDLISKQQFEESETRFKGARASLDAAKKAREEARAAMERAEALSLEVSVKEKEYDKLRDERRRRLAVYDSMKNQLDAAVAGVKEMQAILRDTSIYASVDGTVINKLVEKGELVAQGTPLATLVDLSDIYARVYIPEKEIGKVRLGNPARIYSDAFPGRPFGATVIEISQKAEFTPKEVHMKEERTKLVFGVKVKIDDPKGYLKLGMPVDVKIKWKGDVPW